MAELDRGNDRFGDSTRRQFLGNIGGAALAGGIAAASLGPSKTDAALPASKASPGKVGFRVLGKTGLRVSEVGFGGHSWSYARVPDSKGGLRTPSLDEAELMIGVGMEMGVNFFDCCTPMEEHTVPGEVLRRLKARDRAIISARLCHKQKGIENDKKEVFKFVEERLAALKTDRIDVLMVTNTENDTRQSGYWDMSYAIEALDKVKQQGKIRFTGFGCHFTPELFLTAFEKYGREFDVVSLPYNVRHRAAETIMPAAEKLGMGIVTIKPFGRGELLTNGPPAARAKTGTGPGPTPLGSRTTSGGEVPLSVLSGPGLTRDMMAFVLQNQLVDVCICGVHTEAHVRENFSGSWSKLTPESRQRLQSLAATASPVAGDWLERGWRYA
jgi:aryl-alcohol dehydrogenase-like predicted oxidoreductase